MNPRNWFRFLPSLFQRAEHLLRHPEELPATLAKALGKAYAKRSVLFKVFEDFLMLFRLVRGWVIGEYTEAPKKTIFWAILAIIYFLSPLDFVPDIFPGGYFDDIALISFVIRRFKSDLDKFSEWERARKR